MTEADKLYRIARALARDGCLQRATILLRRAVELDPGSASLRAELVWAHRRSCDWREFAMEEAWLRAVAMDDTQRLSPFHLLLADIDPAVLQAVARRWGRGRRPPAAPAFAHDGRSAGARIRIGYLSADFQRHATACLVRELFERHDRSRFEVIGYSLGADDGGAERLALAASLDRLVDLRGLDDIAAAARIHADGIDILVDLKGYTSGARTAVLAQRPAPIQVNFLGYPGTMGVDFIDYLIADPIILPLDRQAFYDERIVHLPDCYQPNDARRHDATISRGRAAFGLPEAGFVFCCFNAPWKLTPALFALWMRLLAATPASVLWLLGAGGPATDNLRRTAIDHGVAPERLIFAGSRPPEEHLARQRAADLFLDTLPYNAHTTAADALWEGLPLLSCTGSGFAGRVATSMLHAAGLPELAVATLQDYEATALALARDPARLAGIRDHLHQKQGPLFDMARYTRHLEAAYRRMWDDRYR